MRELLTSVLATVMLPMISVGLFASENTFSFLSNCDKENLLICEISLPRGESYTNIANRVQFMYVVQKEIVNLSHHHIYDDQYLKCKYEQIGTAFTNLTSAVNKMKTLLRETHDEMINCNVRYTTDKQQPTKLPIMDSLGQQPIKNHCD